MKWRLSYELLMSPLPELSKWLFTITIAALPLFSRYEILMMSGSSQQLDITPDVLLMSIFVSGFYCINAIWASSSSTIFNTIGFLVLFLCVTASAMLYALARSDLPVAPKELLLISKVLLSISMLQSFLSSIETGLTRALTNQPARRLGDVSNEVEARQQADTNIALPDRPFHTRMLAWWTMIYPGIDLASKIQKTLSPIGFIIGFLLWAFGYLTFAIGGHPH